MCKLINNSLPKQHPESYLFSFEGIEGSGKTTQIQLLKEYLEQKDYNVLCLREPGGTKFGEQLRHSILNSKSPIHPLAEAHLFAASRTQLIAEKILPFLESPQRIIILDRYIDSSISYQGVARKLGIDTILDIHAHPPLDLRPDKTFYLKIPISTSMERQKSRGNNKDYFEKEAKDFYLQLIEGFEKCANRFPKRIDTINANASVKIVHQQIIKAVNNEYQL